MSAFGQELTLAPAAKAVCGPPHDCHSGLYGGAERLIRMNTPDGWSVIALYVWLGDFTS